MTLKKTNLFPTNYWLGNKLASSLQGKGTFKRIFTSDHVASM